MSIEILRDIQFDDAVKAWAERAPEAVDREHKDWVRAEVVAAVRAAGVTDCIQVRVSPEDIPAIFVMGARPVRKFSAALLQDDTGYESARFARALTCPVEGPFLAVARTRGGPLTILDGLHRMSAWVGHVDAGRRYSLEVNLVLTERPVQGFEVRE